MLSLLGAALALARGAAARRQLRKSSLGVLVQWSRPLEDLLEGAAGEVDLSASVMSDAYREDLRVGGIWASSEQFDTVTGHVVDHGIEVGVAAQALEGIALQDLLEAVEAALVGRPK
jgi:hypothetical protein